MDPQIEAALVGAILGACLGSLGTYLIDTRKAVRERDERKAERALAEKSHCRSVATCLLQDLHKLELEFSQFYEHERPSRLAIAKPQLFWNTLLADVRLFRPNSINEITEVFQTSDHFYNSVETVHSASGGRVQSNPRLEFQFRSQAAYVLQRIPAATKALLAEGGVLSGQPNWVPTTYPTLPPVPPPTFAETKTRSDTMAEHRARNDA